MRIAAFGATLLFAFAACSTTNSASESPFQQPNSLMTEEISRRVEQIPYQHRDELLQNLLWLAQTGEQTIPALLEGLQHENPKVRSSAAWVLGRIADRRTIPDMQRAMRDSDSTVRMECARTLVVLGDLVHSPALIEGLDSDRKEVRYMCHEALKTATGHDFGYDHLNQNANELQLSVLRWRQWWSEYSGDSFFAQSYQQKNGLLVHPAGPSGETKPAATTPNVQPPLVPDAQQPLSPNNQQATPVMPNTTDGSGNASPTVTPVPAPRPNTGSNLVEAPAEPMPITAPAPVQTPAPMPVPVQTPAPTPRPIGGK